MEKWRKNGNRWRFHGKDGEKSIFGWKPVWKKLFGFLDILTYCRGARPIETYEEFDTEKSKNIFAKTEKLAR